MPANINLKTRVLKVKFIKIKQSIKKTKLIIMSKSTNLPFHISPCPGHYQTFVAQTEIRFGIIQVCDINLVSPHCRYLG